MKIKLNLDLEDLEKVIKMYFGQNHSIDVKNIDFKIEKDPTLISAEVFIIKEVIIDGEEIK